METYEQQTQDKYGLLLARQAELDQAIAGLEIALMENDTYQMLTRLKEEREHLYDDFKDEVMREFEEKNIKTVDGTYGKITMRENVRYRIVDEKKVPKKFFKQALDLSAVKKEYLLNKTVDGVERVVSHSVILTPKRTGESS